MIYWVREFKQLVFFKKLKHTPKNLKKKIPDHEDQIHVKLSDVILHIFVRQAIN